MTYYVIGTMSGSSLDGLDLVHASITLANGKWQFKILHHHYVVYDDSMRKSLKEATELTGYELIKLDRSFGKFVAEEIHRFIIEKDLTYNVHLIGHHGHTIFHAPEEGFTYQIGCGAEIAAITGYPTVTHLRDMDVALKGSGAPIIPITDHLLFPEYDAYINLGGICNITYQQEEYLKARDLTFCNQLLNYIAQKIGLPYDDQGKLASLGEIDNNALYKLNQIKYLNQHSTQSLSNHQLEHWIEIIDNLDIADAISTSYEHIAYQITEFCSTFLDPRMEQSILLTGGGAHNTYLVERLKSLAAEKGLIIHWTLPSKEIIDFKEALGMAFMAVLRWREEDNVYSSWSGAQRNSIGGALWMGAH